jgi:hypothetical protein
MKRTSLIVLAVAIPAALLVWWISNNTYWEEVKVPMPPKGEALTNPFYAAQKFAAALGAQTTWDRALTVSADDDVVVLHSWHWSLSPARRQALERWVEAGGRLVVDDSLTGGDDEFEDWSGIEHGFHDLEQNSENDGLMELAMREPCRSFEGTETRRRLCDVPVSSFLRTAKPIVWQLRDKFGIQAMRVNVGRGSVTVINAWPFVRRHLFDGDHGWLFAAATELRKGDRVLFLSELEHPSLLTLMWQNGAPVVVLSLMWAGLALWRGGVRFGPLEATGEMARRSLAEQIRGTGQFVLRHGHGEALHAACVRALNEAAVRRVPNYARLSADERVAALARVTGLDRQTLAAAVHQTGVQRPQNLRATIALIESVRRELVSDLTQKRYGTTRNHRHN